MRCWATPGALWSAIGAVTTLSLISIILIPIVWNELWRAERELGRFQGVEVANGTVVLDSLAGVPDTYCPVGVSYVSFDWRPDGRVENPVCNPFGALDLPLGGILQGTTQNASLLPTGVTPGAYCSSAASFVSEIVVGFDARVVSVACDVPTFTVPPTGIVPGPYCNGNDSLAFVAQLDVNNEGRIGSITCGNLGASFATIAAGGDLTGFYPNPTLAPIMVGGCFELGAHTVCVDTAGRITNVSLAGADLVTVTGPPVTSTTLTGTWGGLSLASLFAPGSYSYGGSNRLVSFTHDQYGRITLAADGATALTTGTSFFGAVTGTYNTLSLASRGIGTGSIGSSTCIPVIAWSDDGLFDATPTCVPLALPPSLDFESGLVILVGTPNRVLVTFDNITNITTLSAPQDLHTAANVQFHNGTFSGQLVLGPVPASSRQGGALHSLSTDVSHPDKRASFAIYGTDSSLPYVEEGLYEQGSAAWSFRLHGVAFGANEGEYEYTTVPSAGGLELQFNGENFDIFAFGPAPSLPANATAARTPAFHVDTQLVRAELELETVRGVVANTEALSSSGRTGKNYNSFAGPPAGGRASVELYVPGQSLPAAELGASTNAEYLLLGGFVGSDGLYHTRTGSVGSTLLELAHRNDTFTATIWQEGVLSIATFHETPRFNAPIITLNAAHTAVGTSSIEFFSPIFPTTAPYLAVSSDIGLNGPTVNIEFGGTANTVPFSNISEHTVASLHYEQGGIHLSAYNATQSWDIVDLEYPQATFYVHLHAEEEAEVSRRALVRGDSGTAYARLDVEAYGAGAPGVTLVSRGLSVLGNGAMLTFGAYYEGGLLKFSETAANAFVVEHQSGGLVISRDTQGTVGFIGDPVVTLAPMMTFGDTGVLVQDNAVFSLDARSAGQRITLRHELTSWANGTAYQAMLVFGATVDYADGALRTTFSNVRGFGLQQAANGLEFWTTNQLAGVGTLLSKTTYLMRVGDEEITFNRPVRFLQNVTLNGTVLAGNTVGDALQVVGNSTFGNDMTSTGRRFTLDGYVTLWWDNPGYTAQIVFNARVDYMTGALTTRWASSRAHVIRPSSDGLEFFTTPITPGLNAPMTIGTYMVRMADEALITNRPFIVRSDATLVHISFHTALTGASAYRESPLEIATTSASNSASICFDCYRNRAGTFTYARSTNNNDGYVIYKDAGSVLRFAIVGNNGSPAAPTELMRFEKSGGNDRVYFSKPIVYPTTGPTSGSKNAIFVNGVLTISTIAASSVPDLVLVDLDLRTPNDHSLGLNGTLKLASSGGATTTITLCFRQDFVLPAGAADSGSYLFAYDRRGATYDLLDATYAPAEELCVPFTGQTVGADGVRRGTSFVACLLQPLEQTRGCQLRIGRGPDNSPFAGTALFRTGCVSTTYVP